MNFRHSDANIRGYRGEKAYRLLEQDGAIMHESVVTGGDILIGRTSPPRFMEEYKEFEVKGPYRRDTSVGVRPSENGVVDSVIMTQSVEGGKMYKIRVRTCAFQRSETSSPQDMVRKASSVCS